MSTPFRHAEPQSFCAICEAETTLACLRCGRPGCATHLFGDPVLCGECDLGINSRDLREERHPILSTIATLAGYFAAQVVGAVVAGPIGMGAAVALCLGGGVTVSVVGRRRKRSERRRYVAERRSLAAG